MPLMPRFVLVVDTFELTDRGDWKLVVRHSFYGDSSDECAGVLQAHMRTDAFLRACASTGHFGAIRCRCDMHPIALSVPGL